MFILVMQLNKPLEFVRSFLQHETGMYIRKSGHQKTWSVRCKTGDTHVRLAKGWRNFAPITIYKLAIYVCSS